MVTGCMAERYGDELRDALPEVDLVAGFGRELSGRRRTPAAPLSSRSPCGRRRLPARPTASTCSSCHGPPRRAPWAYVKVAEGCDRVCGFCAIPSFRGKQRSRMPADVLAEVDALPRRHPAPAPATRGGPRGPGSRLLRPRPHGTAPSRRTADGGSPLAALTRAVASAVERDPAALPLPVRPHRRVDRDGARYRRALLRPLAPARVPPAPRRHAAVGRRRAFPAPHRRHPRRRARTPRSAPPSSSATPGRPSATTTCSSSSSRRRSSTGPASSRSPRRRARTRPDWGTRSRPSWRSSACASAPSSRTPSPP